MGLLGRLGPGRVAAGLGGHVVGAVALGDLAPGGGQRRLREGGAVGAHVGDVAPFVEPLGRAHGLGRRHAQLAAGLLLERRGHEGRSGAASVGLALDGPHGEVGVLEVGRQGAGGRFVEHHDAVTGRLTGLGEVPSGGHPPAVESCQRGVEALVLDAVPGRGEGRLQVPPRRRAEAHAGPLALDDHAGGHALDPSGRQPGHHLLPQHRADLVAVEAVEDPPGFLGVDAPQVEVAGLGDGCVDGRPGDLVEDHPAHRDLGVEHLAQVPGDGLALAVLVGREVDLAGLLDQASQLGHLLLLLPGHDVERPEVVLDVDAQAGPGLALVPARHLGRRAGEVADVADRGLDHVVPAEEPGDGPGLGGGLHDHEGLGHVPHANPASAGLSNGGAGLEQARALRRWPRPPSQAGARERRPGGPPGWTGSGRGRPPVARGARRRGASP